MGSYLTVASLSFVNYLDRAALTNAYVTGMKVRSFVNDFPTT